VSQDYRSNIAKKSEINAVQRWTTSGEQTTKCDQLPLETTFKRLPRAA
jgi:hypothetical protein